MGDRGGLDLNSGFLAKKSASVICGTSPVCFGSFLLFLLFFSCKNSDPFTKMTTSYPPPPSLRRGARARAWHPAGKQFGGYGLARWRSACRGYWMGQDARQRRRGGASLGRSWTFLDFFSFLLFLLFLSFSSEESESEELSSCFRFFFFLSSSLSEDPPIFPFPFLRSLSPGGKTKENALSKIVLSHVTPTSSFRVLAALFFRLVSIKQVRMVRTEALSRPHLPRLPLPTSPPSHRYLASTPGALRRSGTLRRGRVFEK